MSEFGQNLSNKPVDDLRATERKKAREDKARSESQSVLNLAVLNGAKKTVIQAALEKINANQSVFAEQLTEQNLKQFQRAAANLQEDFKRKKLLGGITAQLIISHSSRKDIKRAQDEIHTINFTWREFLHSQTAERLGLKNEPTASEKQNIQAVAQWLEKLRALLAEKYGRVIPIRITSGFRSQAVNRAVHGAPTSAHRFGNAADIQAVGLSIKQLAYDIFEFIQSGKLPKLDQLIREMPRHGGQWVHIGLKNHNGAVRNQILLYKWKASAAKNAYISVAALKKVETNLA